MLAAAAIFKNHIWSLGRLHLRERGAKDGEKEPDHTFHPIAESKGQDYPGNSYSGRRRNSPTGRSKASWRRILRKRIAGFEAQTQLAASTDISCQPPADICCEQSSPEPDVAQPGAEPSGANRNVELITSALIGTVAAMVGTVGARF
jgi:hypothetical protein